MTVRRRPGCRRSGGGQRKIIYIYIYVIYVSNPATSVANRNKLCFVIYVFVDVRKFYGPKITICRPCSVLGGSSEESKKSTRGPHICFRAALILLIWRRQRHYSLNVRLKRLELGVGTSKDPGFWHVFSVLYSMHMHITRRVEMSSMALCNNRSITFDNKNDWSTRYRSIMWIILIKPRAIGTRVKYDFVVFAFAHLECGVVKKKKNVK